LHGLFAGLVVHDLTGRAPVEEAPVRTGELALAVALYLYPVPFAVHLRRTFELEAVRLQGLRELFLRRDRRRLALRGVFLREPFGNRLKIGPLAHIPGFAAPVPAGAEFLGRVFFLIRDGKIDALGRFFFCAAWLHHSSPAKRRSPDLPTNFPSFRGLVAHLRIASRYDKLGSTFMAMIRLASICIWLRAYEFTA
jgi:hypothetical protein